jgi:flavin-dependent dehydrogenase
MTVTGPGGVSVSADYPDGLRGFAIARRDLDILLVDAASGAGAQFEPGVRVEAPLLGRDGRGVTGVRVRCGPRTHDLSARLVIAADGRASKLVAGLRLGRFAPSPRRWAFGAYFDGVEGLRSHGEMHIRADGYIGVAPLPGGVANVCVVREAARGAAAPRVDQARAIGDAVGADSLLRGRFDRAIRRSEVMVLGPLSVEARAAGCPGLLLAGDAAGFVDPMTGDGMRFALRGAVLAAEAALRELSSGSPAFGDLAAARTREFAGKWRVNRALRALVGSPRALTLAALVAQRWSAPVEYLIGVAGDVARAHDTGHGEHGE